MIKFIDLRAQYKRQEKEIQKAISAVVERGLFIGGPKLNEFEKSFAQYLSVKFCLGVGNGTDALEIGIEALGLDRGSEIICPVNSFIATAEAIDRVGHKPVFADCNDDFLISSDSIRTKITKKTKAIIVVHLYGQPCDVSEIRKLAGKEIRIIEDCAQAHGAEITGKKVGTLGDIAAFSFFPAKNLGAYGDAGAIVTNNASLYKKAKLIANHGRASKYNHEMIGRNSRLDALQAAILSVKLKKLDILNSQRVKNAKEYLSGLEENKNIILPKVANHGKAVFHQFVIRAKKRAELMSYLELRGVETMIHYPKIITDQKAFKSSEQFAARKLSREILSLPVAEHLRSEDIRKVVKLINQFYYG